MYPVLSPINEKEADMLEGVQRRTTKMISSFKKFIIQGMIEKVGYVLSKRLRGNNIEVFSLDLPWGKYRETFLYIWGWNRKKSLFLKIRKHVNSNIGLKLFTSYWNQCTDEVVNCKSMNIFKVGLDEFMITKMKF